MAQAGLKFVDKVPFFLENAKPTILPACLDRSFIHAVSQDTGTPFPPSIYEHKCTRFTPYLPLEVSKCIINVSVVSNFLINSIPFLGSGECEGELFPGDFRGSWKFEDSWQDSSPPSPSVLSSYDCRICGTLLKQKEDEGEPDPERHIHTKGECKVWLSPSCQLSCSFIICFILTPIGLYLTLGGSERKASTSATLTPLIEVRDIFGHQIFCGEYPGVPA